MKAALAFLLLVGFSLDFAAKCDSYFVGNVHNRRRGHGVDEDDEPQLIQGCKKGCFWNETYTDDGVPKCEKCSKIEEEIECLSHTATCRWTKSGKCRSQTCPGIAKARVTLYKSFNDNSTLESQYRDQVRKEKECIEGSALEQKFNKIYWEDFSSNYNQRHVWNVADTCTMPVSTFDPPPGYYYPYSWASLPIEGRNSSACSNFYGCYWDGGSNRCLPNDCDIDFEAITDPNPTKIKALCKEGCIYIRGTSSDGAGDGGDKDPDICEPAAVDSCTRSTPGRNQWVPGTNNSEDCVKTAGCAYFQGEKGENYGNLRKGGLATTDKCVPVCPNFVAGTNTRKDCESKGCTYDGGDSDPERPGINLKTFQDIDKCPDDRHPPNATANFCGINVTLDDVFGTERCDDRIYDDRTPGGDDSGDNSGSFSCTIPGLPTEEACKSGHGIWYNPPPKVCRKLPGTIRSECEFVEKDGLIRVVNEKNLTNRQGGNQRPGTKKERCIQNHYEYPDDDLKEEQEIYGGAKQNLSMYLTSNLSNYERIYGYSTPEDYCEHRTQLYLLEECRRKYDLAVAGCHSPVKGNKVTAEDYARSTIQVKAARSACHRIYGCMYSKSNERCSVWSVWAFIFTIIITVVVFVVAVGIGAVFILPILKRSAA